MLTRKATHAGSWYTSNSKELDQELTTNLAIVQPSNNQIEWFQDESEGVCWTPPVTSCKAIIAPHAGYFYSGRAAAWAYKCIETQGIKRVFILGPSHHVRLGNCALSQCTKYETPLGDLPLDLETIAELRATGQFGEMSLQTDEDEHSIEMHLPYVRKMFSGVDITVVPILVGNLPYEEEKRFGTLLAPYLARQDTFTIVSSDFCHWGSRFGYTFYYPMSLPLPSSMRPINLSKRVNPSASRPIWASIADLDKEAMKLLTLTSDQSDKPASAAHATFNQYLTRTGNTICGRHPIGVLFGALSTLEKDTNIRLQWTRYEQSSQCVEVKDSSVSYASAFVTF